MASQQEPYVTPEQYLAMEESSETKHEYFDGRVYAMSGAHRNHVRITGNVLASLHGQLRGRSCEVFGSDMKVRVAESGLYTYPDLTALCGRPRFDEAWSGILLNPTLIAEVLSPSTESYDRGRKFAHYRKLSSLREYVLLAQDAVRAERFVRDGDEWRLFAYDGPDATLELTSIGCALALRDVYERVELPPDPPLRALYEQPAAYAGAAVAP